jgi:DNA polymerase III subunit gamma/tau
MLAEARAQYNLGVEPLAMMSGLLAEVHRLTLAKIGAPHDGALDNESRDAVEAMSDQLTFPVLHRLWQLLLKGHDEVSRAAMPLECSDMALLRVVHGASLPDPGELAKMIERGGSIAPPVSTAPSNAQETNAPTSKIPPDFTALLAALEPNYPMLESTMRDVVRLIEYAPPRLVYQLSGPIGPGFSADLRDALQKTTGERWELEIGEGDAAPTLLEVERAQEDAQRNMIMESPLVKAAFAAFPDAELLDHDDSDNKRSLTA